LDEIGRRRAINDETWLGPGVRFLCIANRESLASDHSTSCRRVIESEWYQGLWGDRYQLQPDQNAKMRFDTTCGGFRVAGKP
jgi:hypothetical protein